MKISRNARPTVSIRVGRHLHWAKTQLIPTRRPPKEPFYEDEDTTPDGRAPFDPFLLVVPNHRSGTLELAIDDGPGRRYQSQEFTAEMEGEDGDDPMLTYVALIAAILSTIALIVLILAW